MKYKIVNKKNLIILIFILVVAFLYFGGVSTYNSYESNIDARVSNDVSGIHFFINGHEIDTANSLNPYVLENVTWTNTHTRALKISPGSQGEFSFNLTATGSEVAILYEIQFVDKVIDGDKILTFQNVTSNRTLVRTDEDTYSGIFSLQDIQNNASITIHVDFLFDASIDIEGYTEDSQIYEEFFEINFHVLQYKGETLVPYTG